MSKFGNYLKEVRKRKNLTMVTLSGLSGVSQSYISQLENGNRTPTKEALLSISEGLSLGNNTEKELIYDAFLKFVDEDQIEQLVKDSSELINRFNMQDEHEKQLLLKSLNEAIDSNFISLDDVFLDSSKKEKHFTISGEPLNDFETDLLKTMILGIKEIRKQY